MNNSFQPLSKPSIPEHEIAAVAGAWHSYVITKSGTLSQALKRVIYLPASGEDFLSMAPVENPREVAVYLQWMKSE